MKINFKSYPRALGSVAAALLIVAGWNATVSAQSLNLDQMHNGSRTAPISPVWDNGAANKNKAHLVEGYSQAYRLVISDLIPGPRSVTIEWDTKKNGKHAIDFITHYQRLLPHLAIFGHHAETINPLLGLVGSFGTPSTFPIPTPSGTVTNGGVPRNVATIFNSLPVTERLMTIYNGTITAMTYLVQENLSGSDTKSRLRIDFTASASTVVLAWGGHLARSTDWGVGFSAGAINGSSYHMRLGDGSQQDRSLSTDAVVALNCSDIQLCTTADACGIAFCNPDGPNGPVCQVGTAEAGTVCGSATGACEEAPRCDGSSLSCPANGSFVPAAANLICRVAAGVCDVAETCNGTSPSCPADSFIASGTVCRAAAGVCDAAEVCTGSSASCPADAKVAAGTVCRAAAGICDVAETCTGTSDACPADSFIASGTVCRAAAGVCDAAEVCTGSSASCPADAKVAAGTVCRAAAGICDVAETCNGIANECPADAVSIAGTVCRPAAGVCDVAEKCDGNNVACPANLFVAAGTECRAAVGLCDVPEYCTGASAACPVDSFMTAGVLCRESSGICDPQEFCTGSSGVCPANRVYDGSLDASCVTSICRTAGFWGTHAGEEKKNSGNITQTVINAYGGGMYVCGQYIENTKVDDIQSALEAMCVSVQGDQRLQLVRQLTAASLNCIMSSGYADCTSAPGYQYYSDCNYACAAGMVGYYGACTAWLDCANKGGSFDAATGFCQTGNCSDNDLPCNGSDVSRCAYPATATCFASLGTCHDAPLCNPNNPAACYEPTGPAGSSNACNTATNNACTVFSCPLVPSTPTKGKK